MAEPIRIGVVGVGKRGTHYLEVLALQQDAAIASVLDIDEERAELAARRFDGVTVSRDMGDMLDSCDALIVSTPDNSHAALTIAALDARRPLLCDKPPGISIKELNLVASAMVKNPGVPFSMAMVLRHHPLYQSLKDILSKQGEIRQAHVLDMMGGEFYFRRWHRFHDYTGSIVLHEGIHSLDLLGWMLQATADSVTCTSSSGFLRPRPGAGTHCSHCDLWQSCRHYVDASSDPLALMYATPRMQEGESRDVCVYNSTRDIRETYALTLSFAGLRTATYALNLVAPVRTRRFTFVCEGAVVTSDELSSTITIANSEGSKTREVEASSTHHGGLDAANIAHFLRLVRSGGTDPEVLATTFGAAATALAAGRADGAYAVGLSGTIEEGFVLCM